MRWLLAEIIFARNEGRPVRKSEASHWASHTKIHKIEASVFEKFQIPVTRSWYKFGAFVHSDALDNPRFLYFRNDYSRHPERVRRLRRDAADLGLPVSDILAFVKKRLVEFEGTRLRDFLTGYYEREAPRHYADLYVAKQKLSNLFEDVVDSVEPFKQMRFSEQATQVSDLLSKFSEAASGSFSDERLLESNIIFMDIVEMVFDKIVLLIERRSKPVLKVSFFNQVKSAFDDSVWNPFACEISQRTVTGFRADDERKKMKFIEEKILKEAPARLQKLEKDRQNERLGLSWEELQNLKKKTFADEKTARTLSDLIGIYGRAKDD